MLSSPQTRRIKGECRKTNAFNIQGLGSADAYQCLNVTARIEFCAGPLPSVPGRCTACGATGLARDRANIIGQDLE